MYVRVAFPFTVFYLFSLCGGAESRYYWKAAEVDAAESKFHEKYTYNQILWFPGV